MSLASHTALDRRLNIKPEYRQSYVERLIGASKAAAHREALRNPRNSVDHTIQDLIVHSGSSRARLRQHQIDMQNQKLAARLKCIAAKGTAKYDETHISPFVFNPGKIAARLDKARRLSRENIAIARRLVETRSTTTAHAKEYAEHERHVKLLSRIHISPKINDRVASGDYSELERLVDHHM